MEKPKDINEDATSEAFWIIYFRQAEPEGRLQELVKSVELRMITPLIMIQHISN